jgi:cob(I)alamin adenosyltransferase
MKIYTKTGDCGDTGLFGGGRVRKNVLRMETTGTVDELNALLGVARAAGLPSEIDEGVKRIQRDLFAVGAELATTDPARHGTQMVGATEIERLEALIDSHDADLPPLTNFILPDGTAAATQLHLARTVCRRAERLLVSLIDASAEPISGNVLIYLNRLGDVLFVLARAVNHTAGVAETKWLGGNGD